MIKKLSFILPLVMLLSPAGAAVTSNLVAYWNFEGNSSNNPAGSGGAAYNGVLLGNAAITGVSRAGSGGLALDGSGDYMNVPANVNANGAWTVSAWFFFSTPPSGTARAMIFESAGTPNTVGYSMSFGIREGSPTTATSFQIFTDLATGTDPNVAVQIDDSLAVGAWHNIISVGTPATATIAGSVIGYLDGVSTYSLEIPAGGSLVPVNEFRLGTYRSANDRWFNGSLDEVALWDRNLSAAEASQVYNLGLNGQAIPEPAPVLLAGLSLLGLWGRRRQARVPDPQGNMSVGTISRRDSKCFFLPAAGLLLMLAGLSTPRASADLLTDLPGYYSFESQTAGTVPNGARDLSSPGFQDDGARLRGGESVTSSVPLSTEAGTFRAGTGALACDGNGDYADLPVSPVIPTEDFTVSVWFKPQTGGAGFTGTTRGFVFESKPAYAISFGLRAGSAGNTSFQIYADIATGTDPNQSFEMPNSEVDQWHHFVYTWTAEEGAVRGYLDGELRYEMLVTEPLSDFTGFNTGTYRNGDGRWFKGFIDEEVFWQRAITQDEVTALFTEGGGGKSFSAISGEAANQSLKTGLTAYYPFDTHTDRAVANAAVALGAPGFPEDSAMLTGDYASTVNVIQPLTDDALLARAGKGALLCDGVDNCAVIDGNPVDQTQSWTVSVWFKPDTGGVGYIGTGSRGFIYETGVNYPLSLGLRGGASGEDTNLQLYTLRSDNSAAFADYGIPNSDVDQWHHFIETYDVTTGDLTGYLDGQQTHLLSDKVGDSQVLLQTYTGFRLGTYRGADGRWFKGLIDETAMWQRPLSAAEAAQVYSLGKQGLALTIPPGKGPEITGFSPVPGSPGVYELTWATTAGLKYSVEATSDLSDWSTSMAEDVPATGASLSFRIYSTFPAPQGALYDPGASSGTKRFYRVKLKP